MDTHQDPALPPTRPRTHSPLLGRISSSFHCWTASWLSWWRLLLPCKHPTSIHLLDQKKDGAVQVREQTARLDHLLKEVPEPAPRLDAAVSDAVGNGEQTRSGTPLPALWFGQPDPNNQETRRNQHYHQPWHCFRPIEHAWLLFMFLFISFSPSAHTPSWHLSTHRFAPVPAPSTVLLQQLPSHLPQSPLQLVLGGSARTARPPDRASALQHYSAEPAVQERACTTARSYP
jgi:hypothetical protein